MATVTQSLDVGAFVPFATAIPQLRKTDGTNDPVFGPSFIDNTTDQQLLSPRWLAVNYGASNPNINVLIDWYSFGGATTGAVVWGCALQAVTPGDAQSIETDTFATENTATTTVTGTAKALTRSTVTITNLDGIAPNDSAIIRLTRRQSNGADTLVGDAVVVGVYLQYADT